MFSSDIDACSVEFVVAAGVEGLEDRGEGGGGGDTGAGGRVRAEGHETKDYAGFLFGRHDGGSEGDWGRTGRVEGCKRGWVYEWSRFIIRV